MLSREENILLQVIRERIRKMDNIPLQTGKGTICTTTTTHQKVKYSMSEPERASVVNDDGTGQELNKLCEEECNLRSSSSSEDLSQTEIENMTKKPYSFTIEKLLGKGAYGKVVQAKDSAGKLCAIKILKDEDDTPEDNEQNLWEVKIMKLLSQLDCGNFSCIQMIKSYQFEKFRYLQLPLYGPTVKQMMRMDNEDGVMKAHGFLVLQIKEILTQLFTALSFLHAHHIFHTDIKTDNIIFTQSKWCTIQDPASGTFCMKMARSDIRLIDFGLAIINPETKKDVRSICCTLYRPPEVILKNKISYPVDIWCTGLVAVALYLGRELFARSTTLELLAQMEIVLGSFPPELLQVERAQKYFLENGKTKRPADFEHYLLYPVRPLIELKKSSSPDKNTDKLFGLLQRMLKLDSRDRPTSDELLHKIKQF